MRQSWHLLIQVQLLGQLGLMTPSPTFLLSLILMVIGAWCKSLSHFVTDFCISELLTKSCVQTVLVKDKSAYYGAPSSSICSGALDWCLEVMQLQIRIKWSRRGTRVWHIWNWCKKCETASKAQGSCRSCCFKSPPKLPSCKKCCRDQVRVM